MLRPAELKSMRAAMETALASRCDILANVGGINDLGNPAEDWQPTNSSPLPCRVVPQTGTAESDVAGETTSAAEASIILPFDAVVTAANRIRIVGGLTYEVAYRQPVQAEDVSLYVDAKLVE